MAMGGNLPGVAAIQLPTTAKPRGRPTIQRKREGDTRGIGAAQLIVVG